MLPQCLEEDVFGEPAVPRTDGVQELRIDEQFEDPLVVVR
jgi:hypothetical protein